MHAVDGLGLDVGVCAVVGGWGGEAIFTWRTSADFCS